MQTTCSAAEEFAPGAWYLSGFVREAAPELLQAVDRVAAAAPLRVMLTPGGRSMSVTMTNCGGLGWVSDRRGYRYATQDPLTGQAWPAMPANILDWSRAAAQAAGFANFQPDACLINCYLPGARMSLHQDKNERDFTAPIVSLSLGLPATFLFGGLTRSDRTLRLPLTHGDVVVWGGPARLRFHGVLPVASGIHTLTGAARFNLTVRQAGG
jgi:DNA oxidative demethylase